MPDYLLAHDLGTTGDKATLFDSDGRMLATAFASYPLAHPAPDRAEQNAEDWWQAVCRSTRDLMAQRPEAVRSLAAVGFSGMMNGCLLLNDQGEPLRPAIIHADIRSMAQCGRIEREVGGERAYRITGNRIAPYFTLAKLAWLTENEPEQIARTRWCVQTKDYITGRLTGRHGLTDRSDASLTGCFNTAEGEWSAELVAAGGFPARLLPEVHASSTIVGRVTSGAAGETGLPEGLPVVLGGGDGACATAGAGAVRAGDAYHYLGGTSWVAAVTTGFRPDPQRRLSVFAALDPAQCVLYGTVQSAGSSVDWFRDAVGSGGPAGDGEPFAALEQLAASAPAGSRSLFFLPYLAGERSPIWDAGARGVYFGLSAAHGRAELARAVFEGVAYALNSNLTVLAELGLAPSTVRVLGGGMRSALWRKIFAGVYNRPLQLMARLSEATSAGAAMAAGVGTGLFPDYASVAARFAPTASEELPDPDCAALYRRGFAFFQSLYPALAERFAALAEL